MSTSTPPSRRSPAKRCSNCGFDNAPGRASCQNCGLPLTHAANTVLADASTATPLMSPLKSQASTLTLDKQTCPVCGQSNKAAARQCSHCGSPLENAAVPVVTGALPSDPEVAVLQTVVGQRLATGTDIRLEIVGGASTVSVPTDGESIIGRRDPISNSAPEVDLTSFAAYRMGISRRHAALRVVDGVIELLDLGSSNGTFVNGRRLLPHQPQPLRNGDEIGLGRMVLRIQFTPEQD